ncbi:MAG: hypothetical protein ABW049_08610 [Spongiibacteraceae bacterium]
MPRDFLQQVASKNGPARAGCFPATTFATIFVTTEAVTQATPQSANRSAAKAATSATSATTVLPAAKKPAPKTSVSAFFVKVKAPVKTKIPFKTKADQLLSATHNISCFSSHLATPLLPDCGALRHRVSVITIHPVVLSFTAISYRCPECRHA